MTYHTIDSPIKKQMKKVILLYHIMHLKYVTED